MGVGGGATQTHQAEIDARPMTSAFELELQQARADSSKTVEHLAPIEKYLIAARKALQNDKMLVRAFGIVVPPEPRARDAAARHASRRMTPYRYT